MKVDAVAADSLRGEKRPLGCTGSRSREQHEALGDAIFPEQSQKTAALEARWSKFNYMKAKIIQLLSPRSPMKKNDM